MYRYAIKTPLNLIEKYGESSIYECDLNKSLCHWYPIKNPSGGKNIGDTTYRLLP